MREENHTTERAIMILFKMVFFVISNFFCLKILYTIIIANFLNLVPQKQIIQFESGSAYMYYFAGSTNNEGT